MYSVGVMIVGDKMDGAIISESYSIANPLPFFDRAA